MKLPGHMGIKQACALLRLPHPPTTKAELKKRFVQLAKEHHPDLVAARGPEGTTPAESADAKMAQITEAYKTLRELIESCGPGASPAGRGAAGDREHYENVAFTAPGFSKSTGDMWLPWQRAAPTRTMDTATILSKSRDFWAFKAAVRAHEKRVMEEEGRREAEDEKMRSDIKGKGTARSYDGSQFTAAYFKSQRQQQAAVAAGGAPVGRRSSISLWWKYMQSRAPGNILSGIRYIISGK